MSSRLDMLVLALLSVYLFIMGWYLRSILAGNKSTSGDDTASSPTSSRKARSKRRHQGKHCPGCNKLVDARRKVCRHCGHKFEFVPAAEPPPGGYENNEDNLDPEE